MNSLINAWKILYGIILVGFLVLSAIIAVMSLVDNNPIDFLMSSAAMVLMAIIISNQD